MQVPYQSVNSTAQQRVATIAVSSRVVGLFLFLAALSTGLVGLAEAASSVSQYGITWTFSQDRPVGQFANGDWWVVGPVTLSNINPKSSSASDYTNGTMINPIPDQTQGLYRNGADSNFENTPKYDATKNISLQLPIVVQAGNSIYSTVDNPDTWVSGPTQEKTWFRETAVLTVVGSAPPEGSFRPPYAGTNKATKSNWNASSLNYSVLRSLAIPVPANAPALAWLEDATKRPLLEMSSTYVNSNWKAAWSTNKSGGFPRRTYGNEIGHISGAAGLMLNSNLSNTQKQRLAINMVQWGIDIYGLLGAGMKWLPNGGHQAGRLMPIYIAGKMLNDPEILSLASGKSPFQEMLNHTFVTQNDVNTPRATHSPPFKPYTTDMIGMPEWSSGGGITSYGSSEWEAGEYNGYWGVPYRPSNGALNCGIVATILLMGGRAEVNQEAYFRYHIERFYPRSRPTTTGNLPAFAGEGNGIDLFVRDMWDVHINGGTPPVVSPPPVSVTFAVGDRIQVWRSTWVNSTSSMTTPIGSQAANSLGTIIQGPVGPDSDNIIWFKIDYDNGTDGWSGVDNFIKTTVPAPTVTFAVGNRIKVWRSTWVNSTASVTTPIGSQATNAYGTIVQGPVGPDGDNITWYWIDYDSGPDGWSGLDNFTRVPTTGVPSRPTGLRVVK